MKKSLVTLVAFFVYNLGSYVTQAIGFNAPGYPGSNQANTIFLFNSETSLLISTGTVLLIIGNILKERSIYYKKK